jgi:hypothetical protein
VILVHFGKQGLQGALAYIPLQRPKADSLVAKASKFAGAAFSWGGELIFPKAADVEQDARMKARKNRGSERPGCWACMTNPQPAES